MTAHLRLIFAYWTEGIKLDTDWGRLWNFAVRGAAQSELKQSFPKLVNMQYLGAGQDRIQWTITVKKESATCYGVNLGQILRVFFCLFLHIALTLAVLFTSAPVAARIVCFAIRKDTQ